MRNTEYMVELDRVSKRYDHGHKTLSEAIARWLPGGGAAKAGEGQAKDFWSIRDLGFAVAKGETLGVIGANGSGKSTLLKLIAGITHPTEGCVRTRGRVGSLIELGAGFNPALTGRENVYLNGAVLGLTRKEIEECYEPIVTFAGLGEFLEMPVKYYSSGMYAKLGFAIASHIRADVILMDEILAVGDASFQRQCYKKFQDIRESATVIIVSHDLSAVQKVCSRVLWLDKGQLRCDGDPEKVVGEYLESVLRERGKADGQRERMESVAVERRSGTGEVEIMKVSICDENSCSRTAFQTFDGVIIRIRYRVRGSVKDLGFGVKLCTDDNVFLHGTNTFLQNMSCVLRAAEGEVALRYAALPLLAGRYWLTVGATSGNDWSVPYDLRERICPFEVVTSRGDGGAVYFEHHWESYD